MRFIDICDKRNMNNRDVIPGVATKMSVFLAMKGAVFYDSLQQALSYFPVSG